MKFSTTSTAGLSLLPSIVLAAPTSNGALQLMSNNVYKRANGTTTTGGSGVSEACSIGYCTMNGGTTGGAGGETVTVKSYTDFLAAAADDTAKIIMVSGVITSAASPIKIGSNKSIIGASGSKLVGFGLIVKAKKNVIIRNIAIEAVLAENGDALALNKAENVWIDHVDLSSNRDHDKDFYDGLLDATHAADYVSITNCYLHDHWKASLVGHSDSNSAEDTGKLHITYALNHFSNINSRGPSFRFGTGHILNNYYENVSDGINTRQGAQILAEGNVFVGSTKPLYSTDAGFAVDKGNDFGGGANTAEKGTLTEMPYKYTALESGGVKAAVVGKAGQTLKF